MIPDQLLCGIVGHASNFSIIAPSESYNGLHADVSTLDDIIACLDEVHRSCPCGLKLGNSGWRANLPFGQASSAALALYQPQEDQLLDGQQRVEALFSDTDLPPRTIHLMAATVPPLDTPLAQLERGLVKFHGAVCRVIGSREIRLPDTTDFLTIATTPGCFYIDKSAWFLQRYRGDQLCKIPIIRRGPGFGKSTFLSAVSAYFDDCFDPGLFPVYRAEAIRFPHTANNLTPLVVLSLDFKQLKFEESMTDEDMHEECRRFMMAAATAFYQHYAGFFETPPPVTAHEEVQHPYEIVSKFAQACGFHIFLAIDNYTTPFLNVGPALFARIEKAVYWHILAHILVDVNIGHVFRGCITGLPIEGDAGLPFADFPTFERFTEDLSELPEHNTAIGITGDDVRDLLRSYVYLHERDLDETLLQRIAARWAKDHAYPARSVLAALRDVQVAGGRLIAPDVLPGADEDEWTEALDLPASESTGSDSSAGSKKDVLRTPADQSIATFAPPKW